MSNEWKDDGLSPAEREVEAALRGLRPTDAGLDPLVIAYRAGASRRETSLWMWRAAAAVFAIALGAVVLIGNRQNDSNVSRGTLAVDQRPHRTPSTLLVTMPPARKSPSYERLRDRVLEHGLDALSIPATTRDATDDSPTTWRPS
jgi:hypothetical protein